MKQISEAAKKAADWVFEQVEIYNELCRNECRERIHNACEEYAHNLSDYKAKQIAENDAEIDQLRNLVREIGATDIIKNKAYSRVSVNDAEGAHYWMDLHLRMDNALAGGE
ncbi:MAG: hypothetical protein WC905_02625 [Patescibacteria group bacterium]|jgi:hypothetical protein